jgi:chromate reductase, NAD(P)H dehydrogenase (quinone)
MEALRLAILSGSSRPGSYNGKLADLARGLAEQAGAVVTLLDLRALGLPIYDAEVEAAGMPAGALALRDILASHDAMIVASPEYNGFPTPLLINAFDWLSRTKAADGQPAGLSALAGKPVGVMSASPGPFGGLRSLMFTRQFFHNVLGMLVLPEQFALSQAMNAFDGSGQLRDDRHLQAVKRVVQAVLRVGAALRNGHPDETRA